MNIEGYNGYTYVDGEVFNLKGKKLNITESKTGLRYCKLKTSDGKWKSVPIHVIKVLVGDTYNLDGFVEIPNTDKKYFINKYGKIVSFASNKCGVEMTIHYPKESKKYPQIYMTYCGKKCNMSIHQLLGVSFLDKDYIKKGFVCMHLDNNKDNHVLSNLKIGTYSENNKQAYDDGLNCGNIEGVN